MTATEAEEQADTLLREGKLRQAAATYADAVDHVARQFPSETGRLLGLRHRLAWTLLRTGRADEVIALYERNRTPFDHHTWRVLGDLYLRASRLEEAHHSYATVLDWIQRRLVREYVAMLVLADTIGCLLRQGVALTALAPLRRELHDLAALHRRKSIGLPLLWTCLADVHDALGQPGTAGAYRERYLAYWEWYLGPDHISVVTLKAAHERGGGPCTSS
ncbi:hypothetical protein SAMN05216188_13185 [Lentzea xinjiangensis]|uniref:Tetratricopeptide repeat-containing protein n=1 Tax=Lentzea xinjiangensis TaxID=402600 RepID=A0A1H9W9T0_9PSEU|nr:hypothetical protein [Lentzea xinjiangensis]SES30541.1 hypothetical protein SAMN05216188_13185 [Lentzea xinjiangensis]